MFNEHMSREDGCEVVAIDIRALKLMDSEHRRNAIDYKRIGRETKFFKDKPVTGHMLFEKRFVSLGYRRAQLLVVWNRPSWS